MKLLGLFLVVFTLMVNARPQQNNNNAADFWADLLSEVEEVLENVEDDGSDIMDAIQDKWESDEVQDKIQAGKSFAKKILIRP